MLIMKSKKAFTLIECIVSVALLSFLTLLVASFASSVYLTFFASHRRVKMVLTNSLALDRVAQDIFSASCRQKLWDLNAFVFTKETIDRKGKPTSVCVTWFLCNDGKNKGTLMRQEGFYNYATKRWWKKTTSIAEGFFQSFKCMARIENGYVTGVTVAYADVLGQTQTVVVGVRNGFV